MSSSGDLWWFFSSKSVVASLFSPVLFYTPIRLEQRRLAGFGEPHWTFAGGGDQTQLWASGTWGLSRGPLGTLGESRSHWWDDQTRHIFIPVQGVKMISVNLSDMAEFIPIVQNRPRGWMIDQWWSMMINAVYCPKTKVSKGSVLYCRCSKAVCRSFSKSLLVTEVHLQHLHLPQQDQNGRFSCLGTT